MDRSRVFELRLYVLTTWSRLVLRYDVRMLTFLS